jgi:hypothetical protein
MVPLRVKTVYVVSHFAVVWLFVGWKWCMWCTILGCYGSIASENGVRGEPFCGGLAPCRLEMVHVVHHFAMVWLLIG